MERRDCMLQMDELYFSSFDFEQSREDSNTEYDVSFHIEYAKNKKDSAKFRVMIRTAVENKTGSVRIRLDTVGIFTIENFELDRDLNEGILKANTVAIMFPYIRSQISLLTTQPGLHPVMLPPMMIFFPLFTLLEDFGYLPRVAFDLDRFFGACGSCGKQALTICMGLGCNAAGVVGCRIIDSPRERMIAILTNSFVPCNGRFPAMIAVITVFFAGAGGLSAALGLTVIIAFGIAVTLAVSRLLSSTVLRGTPSSFALELPPYRVPKVGSVIVRSVFDRTLFVLGRAVSVAAPAGLIIWVLANVRAGDATLLAHMTHTLDPIGRVLGIDGVILSAFILALPANEIMLPLAVMSYSASGILAETGGTAELAALLGGCGWTAKTAVCVLVFSLLHWPCSTTIITVKKETGSALAALASALLPTAVGALVCIIINLIL